MIQDAVQILLSPRMVGTPTISRTRPEHILLSSHTRDFLSGKWQRASLGTCGLFSSAIWLAILDGGDRPTMRAELLSFFSSIIVHPHSTATCTVSSQDTVDTIINPFSHPFPYPTHHILNFPYYTMQFNTWLLFLTSFSPSERSLSHYPSRTSSMRRTRLDRWCLDGRVKSI